MRLILLGCTLTFVGAVPVMAGHTMTVTQPVLIADDGLLLGNGDLSVSVYQTRDRIVFRFGKGDVWDRRVDYSDDPPPPTIAEIAHGIRAEGWRCSPYGDGEVVAVHGTDNPERMQELCRGTPASYLRRPYPCPKPVGELALQLPPDLPGLTVRQELTVEEGVLRIACDWPAGVALRLTCFIPPQPNVLVVFQQPFYADYVANQVEVGDAYFTGMESLLQMGCIIAEKYYGTRGVFIQLSGYPIRAVDDVLGAVPMGRMAYMTGWAANQYWWRYLFTNDVAWLRQVGYPVLRDCALFYLDFMTLGDDGLYHVFPSNQGEDGFSGDPADFTDRAQVMRHLRYCLRSAIQASEVLGVDPELRQQWRDRLERAAGDDGHPPRNLEGLVQHFHEACPPEFGDGAPPARPVQVDHAGVWPGAGQWVDLWYAGQYTMIAIPSIRSGNLDPDHVFAGLRRIVERWRHPNGLIWAMAMGNYGHCGAWTETLGIAAPLQEMMLQSYGGVLRVFPCWPAAVEARFQTLRAEGAFLVSATWNEGRVTRLEIFSETGGTCRLFAPWPEGVAIETTTDQPVTVMEWAPDIPAFETSAGVTYRVFPQQP